jgi:DNA-binding response OmpR family regulator
MNARVLVIDHEPSVGLLLRYVFDPIHVDVTATTTGAEGLRLLRQTAFEAIYVDSSMRDVASRELIDRLREIRPEVAIVVMTAEPRHRVRRASGAKVYLHKPFRLSELEESLRIARARTESVEATAHERGLPGSQLQRSMTEGSAAAPTPLTS